MKLEIRDCEFGRLSTDDAEDFFRDLVDVMTRYGVIGLDGGMIRIGENETTTVRDFTLMKSMPSSVD